MAPCTPSTPNGATHAFEAGPRKSAELREQMKESARLDKEIWKNLESLGYDS